MSDGNRNVLQGLQSRLPDAAHPEQPLREEPAVGLNGILQILQCKIQFTQRCQDNGLIVRNVAGCSLAMCPPLIIDRGQVDEMVDKLKLYLDKAKFDVIWSDTVSYLQTLYQEINS